MTCISLGRVLLLFFEFRTRIRQVARIALSLDAKISGSLRPASRFGYWSVYRVTSIICRMSPVQFWRGVGSTIYGGINGNDTIVAHDAYASRMCGYPAMGHAQAGERHLNLGSK